MNATKLARKLELFIPAGDSWHAVQSGWVARLSSHFGGVTIVPTTGNWVDAEGRDVAEPINVLTCYCGENATDIVLHVIAENFAHDLLTAGEQAVLVAIDGIGHLYSK